MDDLLRPFLLKYITKFCTGLDRKEKEHWHKPNDQASDTSVPPADHTVRCGVGRVLALVQQHLQGPESLHGVSALPVCALTDLTSIIEITHSHRH